MTYWLELWWLAPIALSICVLVVPGRGGGLAAVRPFYAVIFPWLSGVELAPLQAIQIGISARSSASPARSPGSFGPG
jgi:hypothetical protein